MRPATPEGGHRREGRSSRFGPHGVAVTDMILVCGGRDHLTDWQVEVNHAIKEIGLSFNTDAVLADGPGPATAGATPNPRATEADLPETTTLPHATAVGERRR
ncbi:hypothetical protein [Streptomyces sp. NPDC001816]|uniref:hypothetical protein n=1 Tax=Streptomyces sp. NPDC001816 TaxID=3364612 RepID=UPI00369F0367